ncbi:hypothetical protein, partial [Acidiphilium sp.]
MTTILRRSVFVVVAGFLTYLLASFALFDRTGILTGTHYVGNGADPYLYMWSFYFIPHAIVHGQNPFIISAAWAPAGLNRAYPVKSDTHYMWGGPMLPNKAGHR